MSVGSMKSTASTKSTSPAHSLVDTFTVIKNYCWNLIDTMQELDPTMKSNRKNSINAMTWQGADADLTNRQHIYALKQLLMDTWDSIGHAEHYAVPICIVNNDLACLLSELAIAARSTTTTTMSPEFANTVDKLLQQVSTIEPRLTEKFKKLTDQHYDVLKREQSRTNTLCVGNGHRMAEIDKRNKNFDAKFAELHDKHRQSMSRIDTLFTLHEQLLETELARDKTKSSVPITNDEGITDINEKITELTECYNNTVVTLNSMSKSSTALFSRVTALEKKKFSFFRSDMSTLPALLCQLETHREESE